ncbi:MAG: hypothetical protein COA42_23810 [Alteromonadaceae bacterium]|nr:MAG: hypothetical protein COA42_23810 [Alteromonadaceae bacterium]
MRKLILPFLWVVIGALSALLVFTQTEWGLQNVKPIKITELSFANGSRYIGSIDDSGLLSGKGKLLWDNASYYEGDFKDGLFDGYGKFVHPSGVIHEGGYSIGLAHGAGKVTFVNGDIYEGEFVKDEIEGQGKWTLPGHSVYIGDVKRGGGRHGKGQIVYDSGSKYTGGFRDGLLSGQGVYTSADGEVYSGEFNKDDFTGLGSFSSKDYGIIVGKFDKWSAKGNAIRTDSKGNQWKGWFVDNYLHGEGEYIGVDGEHYKGDFEYGYYNGKGNLTDSDGNQYRGNFSQGEKDGSGKFEYKEAIDGVKKFSGKWDYGRLIEGDSNVVILSSDEIAEFSLYNQQRLLTESLENISSGNPDRPDLYLLGIAGWGRQEVFRREINYIEMQFERLFGTADRSVFLVNSQRNIQNRPLATITSIEKSIHHIAKVMDKDEDIFFLYATSHGSKENGLSLGHKGVALPDLSAQALGDMLKKSGIKHKVIVISACYSGGFIEYLEDEYSLIMTSSAADKTSFGCSDNRLFTYFGKAFFEKTLENASSFVRAFSQAEALIKKWEKDKGITPSEPVIYTTKVIESHLKKWRETLINPNGRKVVGSSQ